ncbi:MAG: uracil-DNA glycosylase [Tissierellia bacterium]|nr:uracil-DNA glycosylase [Tissierellia bacterium]
MVIIGNSWDEKLADEWEKDYYQELRRHLYWEYQKGIVYPDMHDIFNALKTVSYEDVRVVILGQDPYHGPGQAHGYSFSVQPGIKAPPSLQNIYKELREDLGLEIPDNGYLLKWAQQGVLLLNTSLTVRAGQANSHSNLGWRQLTDRIIQLINGRSEPVVYLLWGRNAIDKRILLTNPRHLILTAPHPSPLSAHRGFFGCRHFSKANDFLQDNGMQPIDWQIENLEQRHGI